jgi:hypothetical protein
VQAESLLKNNFIVSSYFIPLFPFPYPFLLSLFYNFYLSIINIIPLAPPSLLSLLHSKRVQVNTIQRLDIYKNVKYVLCVAE